MKKILIIFAMVASIYAEFCPDYGPGDQWCTIQSTSQGGIGFNQILINGEPPVSADFWDGEGSIYQSCDSGNCDIIGVFYDSNCVGWSYTNKASDFIEGEDNRYISFVNLNDFVTPGVGNYPSAGNHVTVKIFDASSGIIHHIILQSIQVFPLSIQIGEDIIIGSICEGMLDVNGLCCESGELDQFGSCIIYSESIIINLNSGNNLISFPGIPYTANTVQLLTDLMENYALTVNYFQGDGIGLYNDNGTWSGNLTEIQPHMGYWINVSEAVEWGIDITPQCYLYDLTTAGSYLINNPGYVGSTLSYLVGSTFEESQFWFIIGQGVGLFNTSGGWSGNLNNLEENKGYWINITEPMQFTWSNQNSCGLMETTPPRKALYSADLPDWTFVNSTSQGFVTIDEISLNGQNPVSGINDGTPTGACPSGVCDIFALIKDQVCVGWSYTTITNGQIHVPVNLNDFVTPGVEDYPNSGSNITLSIFDFSENRVYYGNSEIEVFSLNQFSIESLNISGDGQYADNSNSGCPYPGDPNYDPFAGSGDIELCSNESIGCTDYTACNYDPNAITDNNNCYYPEAFYDCNGNCIDEFDCQGECGGDAILDECGICSGPGEYTWCLDSDGDLFGDENNTMSACQQPDGYVINCLDPDDNCASNTYDCAGTCDGLAVIDDCGVCGGIDFFDEEGILPDGSCDCEENILDCAVDCGGSARIDDCGICSGGTTEHEFNSDMDCNGVCFGNAEIDDCGVCGGIDFFNDEGVLPDGSCDCDGNVRDCFGDCGGNAVEDSYGECCDNYNIDECGQCYGNDWNQCDFDEDGIVNIEDHGMGAYNIQVQDIPNDNGGRVYVTFNASILDEEHLYCLDCMYLDCSGYEPWIGDGTCDDGTYGVYFNCEEFDCDGGDCIMENGECAENEEFYDRAIFPNRESVNDSIIVEDSRSSFYSIERLDNETWVAVQTVAAYGQDYYTAEATTLSDSSSISNGLSEFRVIAAIQDYVFISNETGIGYSLDNIAPSIPTNFFAISNDEIIHLSWAESEDPNLQYYSIYRNGSFFGYADDNAFIDYEPTPPEITFYQISATDYSGNSSSISDPVIPSDFNLGDITLDGQINILDIILLVNFLLVFEEPSSIQEEAADFNQDGAVNISDAVSMVNYILEQ